MRRVCVDFWLMHHKSADMLTLKSRLAIIRPVQRQKRCTQCTPSMQFAYGSSHGGAAWCQLRVTCPLQLLYVIIKPICSAQQGLDGNVKAALLPWEMDCTIHPLTSYPHQHCIHTAAFLALMPQTMVRYTCQTRVISYNCPTRALLRKSKPVNVPAGYGRYELCRC